MWSINGYACSDPLEIWFEILSTSWGIKLKKKTIVKIAYLSNINGRLKLSKSANNNDDPTTINQHCPQKKQKRSHKRHSPTRNLWFTTSLEDPNNKRNPLGVTIDRPSDNSSTQHRNDVLDSCSSDFFSLRPRSEEEHKSVDNGGPKVGGDRGQEENLKEKRWTEKCSRKVALGAFTETKTFILRVLNNDDSSVDPRADNRVNAAPLKERSCPGSDMPMDQIVDKFRVC